jgi:hypothetical protein
MRSILALFAVALLAGCDSGGMSVPAADGGIDAEPAAVDLGGADAQCTRWACVDHGGCFLVCESYDPQPCPPGPWPCETR